MQGWELEGGDGQWGQGGEGGRGRERTSVTGELSVALVAFGSGQFPNADFFFSEDYDPASCTAKKKQLGVSLEVLKATELCVLACLKG